MLWLKRIDSVSRAVPSRPLRSSGDATEIRPIVLRPGGLGDMVLLTRAACEAGVDPSKVLWFGESRNQPWIDLLGLPSLQYDRLKTFLRSLRGLTRSRTVICSEQTFGLAAVFGTRLVARSGAYVGFDSNIRCDLFDRRVPYSHDMHEVESFRILWRDAVPPDSRGAIDRRHLLPTAPTPEDVAILAIGGLQARYKTLSLTAWRTMLDHALCRASRVLLVGAPADASFAAELVEASRGKPVQSIVGTVSFADTVARIRAARRLVSVDSGLVHVADFCGVPSDVVFPGGNPSKWRPLTPGSVVIGPEGAKALESGTWPG